MAFSRSFAFHRFVQLQVHTDDRFAANYFEAEYRDASAPLDAEMPAVRLEWARSGLPRRPSAEHRLKIHKGLSRWYYRLAVGQRDIRIDAAGNRMALPMVHHMLVHGCLRYLCSQEGAVLLHASGLSRSGGSLILTGPGGAGKTTVSSIVLDQGDDAWQWHADDYVFLSPNGETYSYPSRAHIYQDLVRQLPELSSGLSVRQRAHLAFFGIARDWSQDRLKWPLRVEAGALWPERKVAPKATLRSLVLLDRTVDGDVQVEPISDRDQLTETLIDINFREAKHTTELMQTFGLTETDIEQWRSREREIVSKSLQFVQAYRLSLPRTTKLDRAQLESQLQALVTVENERRTAV